MQDVTASVAAGTMAIVFAAAVLRGLTGFGFALAAVPMLGFLMQPAKAVPVSMCIVAAGGIFGARRAVTACHWPSIRRIAIAAAVATPAGAYLLKQISPEAARIAIACFTLAAVVGISRSVGGGVPFGPIRATAYGLTAGLFNGLASMPGPPVVAYFMSTSLSREAIRASNMDVGGRVVELAETEFMVRGRGYLRGIGDIEQIVLKAEGGTPVLLRDVARVELAPDERRGVTELNGEGEVVSGIAVQRFGQRTRRNVIGPLDLGRLGEYRCRKAARPQDRGSQKRRRKQRANRNLKHEQVPQT